MSLIDQIKADQLSARKGQFNVDGTFDNKIVASILTTLIGEVGTVAKNDGREQATDEEVIVFIKKFIKNLEETIKIVSEGSGFGIDINQQRQELEVLVTYLPKQLTEEELVALKASTNPANKGEWMKFLKENYAGRYDGKMASAVF